MDASIAGIGIIIVFAVLAILGAGISIVYLLVPKSSVSRCEDAQLAAILALCFGDLLPLLAVFEMIRQGLDTEFKKLFASISALALFINSALAIILYMVSRYCRSRLASRDSSG
jgi:hypothetical protein